MKRILVTGASGFVGRYVLPDLAARGFEVHALGRTRPKNSGVVFHSVDLLDTKTVVPLVTSLQAGHLLHLAWYSEPGLYWRAPSNLDWTAATLLLVRSFREAGGIRAVGAGTCAEYGWGPPRLSEYMPCAPTTLYGAAKDATRRVLDLYANEHGLSFAWGRVFFLYGPGERHGRLVSDAVRALRAGDRFSTTAGQQRRDFSYVADVASALAAIVDSSVTGPINVASGQAYSVRCILERIGWISGRLDLIDFGALSLDANEPATIEADISRLRDEVGFKPRFDLESGLAQTLGAPNSI